MFRAPNGREAGQTAVVGERTTWYVMNALVIASEPLSGAHSRAALGGGAITRRSRWWRRRPTARSTRWLSDADEGDPTGGAGAARDSQGLDDPGIDARGDSTATPSRRWRMDLVTFPALSAPCSSPAPSPSSAMKASTPNASQQRFGLPVLRRMRARTAASSAAGKFAREPSMTRRRVASAQPPPCPHGFTRPNGG